MDRTAKGAAGVIGTPNSFKRTPTAQLSTRAAKVEEKWNEHCLIHLEYMASLWCATINYCGALFRPSFCPSCLGNTLLELYMRRVP